MASEMGSVDFFDDTLASSALSDPITFKGGWIDLFFAELESLTCLVWVVQLRRRKSCGLES